MKKYLALDGAIMRCINTKRAVTLRSIVAAVKEEATEHLGHNGNRYDRMERLVDRRLQAMRKKGEIAYKNKAWVCTMKVPIRDSDVLQEMKHEVVTSIAGAEAHDTDEEAVAWMKRRARALQRAEDLTRAAEALSTYIRKEPL